MTATLTYQEGEQSVLTYPLNYNYNTNFQEEEKSLRTNLSLPSLTLFTSSTKALRSPVASLKTDSAVTFSYFLSAIHNCVKFQDLSVYWCCFGGHKNPLQQLIDYFVNFRQWAAPPKSMSVVVFRQCSEAEPISDCNWCQGDIQPTERDCGQWFWEWRCNRDWRDNKECGWPGQFWWRNMRCSQTQTKSACQQFWRRRLV